MSSPKWLQNIESRAGKKPVLLVEGNTDIRVLSYFLDQISPRWSTNVVLLPAQRKSQVIKAVSTYHSEWVGIVDRDEWSPQQIDQEITHPRVKVLPRFCLENFFCAPHELRDAIPNTLKNSQPDVWQDVEKKILDVLPNWVAHGAMWRVLRNRRTELLYNSDFPSKLDRSPVTDIQEIKTILNEWYLQLEPNQIITEYQHELAQINLNLEPDAQLKQYVHGKKFYRQVVVTALNKSFKPTNADRWLERFTDDVSGIVIPSDLHDFLTETLKLLDL
ncbi:DUF4435 domain-containing protein [Anaerolineales bacterium HSG6]|nr:DUF4435 domain-containing protein [Anaerolineales bacterium HSG6]